MQTNATDDWLSHGTNQVKAAHGRHVEWYIAEQGAADYARAIFDEVPKLHEGITGDFVGPKP